MQTFKGKINVLVEEAGYEELHGKDLRNVNENVKDTLLNKFLKRNKYDIEKTKSHLIRPLKWGKEFNPISAAFKEEHDELCNDFGVITKHKGKITISERTCSTRLDEKEMTTLRIGLV